MHRTSINSSQIPHVHLPTRQKKQSLRRTQVLLYKYEILVLSGDYNKVAARRIIKCEDYKDYLTDAHKSYWIQFAQAFVLNSPGATEWYERTAPLKSSKVYSKCDRCEHNVYLWRHYESCEVAPPTICSDPLAVGRHSLLFRPVRKFYERHCSTLRSLNRNQESLCIGSFSLGCSLGLLVYSTPLSCGFFIACCVYLLLLR